LPKKIAKEKGIDLSMSEGSGLPPCCEF